MSMAESTRRKRLVALRFSALGDIAMTVPVIYSVARSHPEMDIYVATRPFFGRMFVNAPSNVTVMPFDLKGEYKGVRGVFRIARELARLKADYVADLHDILRTRLIGMYLRMRGARVARVDKARGIRRAVFAGGEPQRQYIDRYFDVFRKLGADASMDFSSIYHSANPVKLPAEISCPAVGIAPFARYSTKTYPPEKMRRVARMLAREGMNVYLFGGRGTEAETLDSWQENPDAGRGEIVSLAGRYPLEEELALMSRLEVMVSMDSANQHLAGLAGTKVVSVWGGTTPACGFLGFGQESRNAVVLNIACQPCTIAGSKSCPLGHMDCLNKISEETIVNKVKELCR